MELDLLWIGIGLALFGYFIGDGLKNFKNPGASNAIQHMLEDDEEYKLIKQTDLHWFIGISKEDARTLVEEHPAIPHIMINGQMYYPRKQLKKWLLTIGK